MDLSRFTSDTRLPKNHLRERSSIIASFDSIFVVNSFNSSSFQFCHVTSATSNTFGPYVQPNKTKNVIYYFKELRDKGL